jgi:26S proteasome regulatory subunit N10
MVLEACMICLDNSEWMRNGDYSPSRLEAQHETVNDLASAKCDANQESTVGVLTLAGNRIDVHVTPTRNLGQIMNTLSKEVRAGGKSNFLGGLKTAQLVLKNRQNKNQRQRIIMFVGSPVECEQKELVALGKTFKKNNIAVDIINFGAENSTNTNPEKLEAFVQAVNNADNSHLLNVPPGPHVLTNLVLTSAIMQGAAAGTAKGPVQTAAGPAAAPGGVDPNVDPELAMVLKMSMEEERARQKPAASAAAPASSGAKSGNAATAPAAAPAAAPEDEDELAAAIALSMAAGGGDEQADQAMSDATPAPAPAPAPKPATAATPARTASTTPAAPPKASPPATPATAAAPTTASSSEDISEALKDPDFLNSLLDSVPDINKADLQLDDILDKLTGDDDKSKKDKDSKDKGGKGK